MEPHSDETRRLAWSEWHAFFWGLALLYNPVFPVFEMSGLPALFMVVASTIPFVAALRGLKARPVAIRAKAG